MAVMKPITVKERKILDKYIMTGSKTQAAMAVREYPSLPNACMRTTSVIGKHNVLPRMAQVFDAVGLTEEHIALKLKQKTDAKRTIYFSDHGMVTESRVVPDHHIQLKALEMAVDIRGMRINRHTSLNLNLTPDDLRGLASEDLDSMLVECEKELESINT